MEPSYVSPYPALPGAGHYELKTNPKITDNVDYNSLKREIKVHTTKDQGTAIAIPGQPDFALTKFEDALFRELVLQHDRVDLFVSSKASEITRRLGTFCFCPIHCLVLRVFASYPRSVPVLGKLPAGR